MLLRGERINLRKMKRSDARSIYRHANDMEIARYTKLPYPYRLRNAKEFIRKTHNRFIERKGYNFGIEWKETETIIGVMSFITVDHLNKNAEIGYWVGREFWGKGIAREAINLILRFGFKRLKLKRVFALVMHPNVRSFKLLESCGFRYEGRMRKSAFRKRRWMDELIYAILRDEFRKLNRSLF